MSECPIDLAYQFEEFGLIILELIICIYLFYAMMILTDEYLMDITINKYSLSNEAGACLIAFGSIVPEFTINIISCLFISSEHSLLGLSTIIGSGCFGKMQLDFTICLGLAAIVAGLKWGQSSFELNSILIDYTIYMICLLFVIGIVYDQYINLVEALLMVLVTPLYVILTFWFRNSDIEYSPAKIVESFDSSNLNQSLENSIEANYDKIKEKVRMPLIKFFDLIIPVYTGKIYQIILAFISIVLLGFGITRGIIFLIQRIMCHMNIPEALVGLTILAWGNNIGDIMNSVVAAKRGNAQLSVSSVLATQILNLQFSLGLPWLITVFIYGDMFINDATTLNSMYFTLLIVMVSLTILLIGKVELKISVGVGLSALYCFYVVMEWCVFSTYEEQNKIWLENGMDLIYRTNFVLED